MALTEKKLSQKEKVELASLLRCERDAKRERLVDKLIQKRSELVLEIDKKITQLELDKKSLIESHGLTDLDRGYSCKPSRNKELGEFDAETNRLLKELWSS